MFMISFNEKIRNTVKCSINTYEKEASYPYFFILKLHKLNFYFSRRANKVPELIKNKLRDNKVLSISYQANSSEHETWSS